MGASKTFLAILFLATAPVAAPLGSDFYLPRVGPAPLRFALTSADSRDFAWPIPLIRAQSITNSTAATNDNPSIGATNSTSSVSNVAASQTNNAQLVSSPETSFSSQTSMPQIPDGANGNPLSASNLLVITPQMLADYFKANLTGTDRLLTNRVSGADIPFNPPTPKPPSSEAIYRIQ
jgi:hypothetical protein